MSTFALETQQQLMSDVICYKCGRVIPPGNEYCPACGAPAPLPDDLIDKNKIRETTILNPYGSVHFAGEGTTDAATRVVTPDSAATHVVTSDSAATHVVTPDSAATHVVTSDSAATHVVTSDSAATHVVTSDSAATHVVTPDSAATHVVTSDSAATHVVTSDSSATHIVPPDSEPSRENARPSFDSQPRLTPPKPHKHAKPSRSAFGKLPWVIIITLLVLIVGCIAALLCIKANEEDANANVRYAIVPTVIYEEADCLTATDSIPYGSEILLYENHGRTSKVRCRHTLDGGETEGYMLSRLLVTNKEKELFNDLVPGTAAKAAIPSEAQRRALIDYMITKGYSYPGEQSDSVTGIASAGQNPWRFYATESTIFTGKVFNPSSQYEDIAIILKPSITHEDSGNILLYFTFDDYGTPLLRIERNIGSDSSIDSVTRDPSYPGIQGIQIVTH